MIVINIFLQYACSFSVFVDIGLSRTRYTWRAITHFFQKVEIELVDSQPSIYLSRKRRDLIFFNPPFNREVKTDIGRQFLKLIDKNFPSNNPISEVINRKTVKLSYSCTDNMEKVISKHNKKILAEETKEMNKKECNCRIKTNCPVDNQCLTESLIYKATLQTADASEYIGLTDNTFKTR